jgi:hypothetical protein
MGSNVIVKKCREAQHTCQIHINKKQKIGCKLRCRMQRCLLCIASHGSDVLFERQADPAVAE